MSPRAPLALICAAFLLAGCATTSAALDGIGGVFQGAGDDVRTMGRR